MKLDPIARRKKLDEIVADVVAKMPEGMREKLTVERIGPRIVVKKVKVEP